MSDPTTFGIYIHVGDSDTIAVHPPDKSERFAVNIGNDATLFLSPQQAAELAHTIRRALAAVTAGAALEDGGAS